MTAATAIAAPERIERRRLGRGRSGEVWLIEEPGGPLATKVFHGDTLSNLIHYVLTGAPNPYIWNEGAIRAAFERRKILAALFPLWFGDRLAVSDAVRVSWNRDARAWELATVFVPGRPVPLLHPYRMRDERLAILVHEVMAPLQRRLIEAGFVGTVWQAGKGNPVALNNYLLTDPDGASFCFIDAESGVPALFPLNPVPLFAFYLPQSFRMGHPLFDDVDTERLRAYLAEREADLRSRLGAAGYEQLLARTERLAGHQRDWTEMSRNERAIAYQLGKGRLSLDQAAFYREHAWRWRAREGKRAANKAVNLLTVRLPRALGWLWGKVRVRTVLENLRLFVTSQAHRTALGAGYVEGRIEHWRERGQLGADEADALRAELRRAKEETSYITDFGAHLGMKASFLVLEVLVLGALALAGVPLLLVGLLFAIDGPIYRTLYTFYRGLRAAVARRALPWVALLVGLLPLLGSLAFPAQMIWAARGQKSELGRFIVIDTFTRLGHKVPIFGGSDTRTEHLFNRLGARLAGRRSIKLETAPS
jgi:hypothetical protein